jgi:glycosyltransferase involved in cell wall biosynthesis
VVVDVQNAVPFFSPMYCGRPVVVLVHHVHREQWGMIFSRRTSRLGWWVESRLSPWLYRRARYITVSEASRDDLAGLGVDPSRVTIVHNGAPRPSVVTAEADERSAAPIVGRTANPSILFLGRLVPHKRIEFVLRAAADLRTEFPGLSVRVAGQGAWEPRLLEEAERLRVADLVSFDGFVSEEEKRRLLRESWTLAMPSVKEGWGLAVMEAAAEGTPAVASRSGGLVESVRDGETGVLADDYEGFVAGLRRVLGSPELRDRLGAAARERAATFRWDETAIAFESVLAEAARTAPEAENLELAPPAVEAV